MFNMLFYIRFKQQIKGFDTGLILPLMDTMVYLVEKVLWKH